MYTLGRLSLIVALSVATMLVTSVGHASVIFVFSESGGNVTMQSSGTLDTSKLVSVTSSGWGGTGIEAHSSPESDIMGDTVAGGINDVFTFHTGTDTSAWYGNMFTSSYFTWTRSGTTGFATYYFNSGLRTPGIGINSANLAGSLWTPDEAWSTPGTFASLGMTPGVYAITDAVTGEAITIKIGAMSVPEPGSWVFLGAGILGLVFARRRSKIARLRTTH